MAEIEKINVETASHMGHVIRVWHDCETTWFWDVDGTSPQRVSFSFETRFDFERQRAQAKELAHQAVHQGKMLCQEELDWKLDKSTKSKVLVGR